MNFSLSSVSSSSLSTGTVSLGFGKLSKTMSTMSGAIASLSTMQSSDSKAERDETQLKQDHSDTILHLLRDISLQTPPSHSGFVVVFAAATLSPLTNAGISFRWFRVHGDTMLTLDRSSRPFYAPTADDINTKIFVQCEDIFDQGCSKYLETTLIAADTSLIDTVTTILQTRTYEVQETHVSIGIQDNATLLNNTLQHDSLTSTLTHCQTEYNLRNFPTALNSESVFLQLNGRSNIEVSESGVFISLPYNPANPTSKPFIKRGMLIPPSSSMRVTCAQPAAVVLSLHLQRQPGLDGDSSTGRTLLPWTYFREFLRKENDSTKLTGHDTDSPRPDLVSDLEIDRESQSFQSALSTLDLFINDVPEESTEVHICISCSSRVVRDELACAVRILALLSEMNINCTDDSPRLKAVLPWYFSPAEKLSSADKGKQLTKSSKYKDYPDNSETVTVNSSDLEIEGFVDIQLPTNKALQQSLQQLNQDAFDAPLETENKRLTKVLQALEFKLREYEGNSDFKGGSKSFEAQLEGNISNSREPGRSLIEDLGTSELVKIEKQTVHGKTNINEDVNLLNRLEEVVNCLLQAQNELDQQRKEMERTKDSYSLKILGLEEELLDYKRRISKHQQVQDVTATTSTTLNNEVEQSLLRNRVNVLETSLLTSQSTIEQQRSEIKQAEIEYKEQISYLEKSLASIQDSFNHYKIESEQKDQLSQSRIRELERSVEDSLICCDETETAFEVKIQDLEAALEVAKDVADRQRQTLQASLQSHVDLESKLSEVLIELHNINQVKSELELQVQESNFKLGEMLKELNQLRMKETDRQDSLALAVEDRDLRIDNLLGDINRLNKLVDSQARDLKRTIRDAALTQSEFEKALMMKNGECEELAAQVSMLEKQLAYPEAEDHGTHRARGDTLSAVIGVGTSSPSVGSPQVGRNGISALSFRQALFSGLSVSLPTFPSPKTSNSASSSSQNTSEPIHCTPDSDHIDHGHIDSFRI